LERRAFSLVDETTMQPSYEFLFPLAEGRVDRSGLCALKRCGSDRLQVNPTDSSQATISSWSVSCGPRMLTTGSHQLVEHRTDPTGAEIR
jgi:hypothetical protein